PCSGARHDRRTGHPALPLAIVPRAPPRSTCRRAHLPPPRLRLPTSTLAQSSLTRRAPRSYSTAAGRSLLRLDLATIALTPSLRLRFEFLGEQHFYGLGEGGPQFDRLAMRRADLPFHLRHRARPQSRGRRSALPARPVRGRGLQAGPAFLDFSRPEVRC